MDKNSSEGLEDEVWTAVDSEKHEVKQLPHWCTLAPERSLMVGWSTACLSLSDFSKVSLGNLL